MDLEQVQQVVAKGQAHFNAGKWAAASKEFTWARDALDRMKLDASGKKVLSEVLQMKAYADARRGQFRTAIMTAERALEISRSIGALEGEAEALHRLGYIHWHKGDLAKATGFFEMALVKAKACGAKVLIGKITLEQGNVEAAFWRYEGALELYLKAAEILKAENEIQDRSRAYNNMGYTMLLQKRFNEAIEAFRTAMELADKAGDARIRSMAALNIAECYVHLGNTDMAIDMMGPVTEAMLDFDDKAGIASAYRVYGMIYTATKHWPKAETYFRRAYALVKVSGVAEMEGAISREYGRMFLAKGDMERAHVKLNEALKVYKKLGVKDKVADVKHLLGQAKV